VAQIIKHRRGTLAELSGVTLANGELGVVTSSVSNIGDAVLKTAMVVGHTDGTNRLSVGRIIDGNATPDLSGVTGGSVFNDMLYHETDAKTLLKLNTAGNTNLDLTGNIANREVNGTLDVTGRVDAQSGLDVTGSLNANGQISGLGGLSLENFSVADSTGNTDIDGTLNVNGTVTLDGNSQALTHSGTGNLTVSSTSGDVLVEGSTFSGNNVTVPGTLDVTSNISVQSHISASGNVTASDIYASGNIHAVGNITFEAGTSGTIQLGDASGDNLVIGADISSSLLPNDDDSFDLGSSGQQWKDLYIDGTANVDTLVLDTTDGLGVGSDFNPTADDTYDLGSSTREWQDLYIDGTANIDTLSADTAAIGDLTDNRVVIAGTSGELEDDANFTFDGSDLDVGGGYGSTGTTISTAGVFQTDGATTLGSTIDVSGIADFQSRVDAQAGLDVTGSVNISSNTNVDGTLDVQGISDFQARVDAQAGLDVTGSVNISSTTNIDGNLDVDNTTTTIDSSNAISLDAGAASNFSTSAGALTLDGAGGVNIEGNGSEIDITTAGATLDVNAGIIDIDATGGAVNIDSDTGINIGTTADKPIDIDSTTLDIDASGALTIDSATSVSIGTTADVAFDIDTSTLDIDSSDAITIDSTAGVSIDGGAASNLSTSDGAITISGNNGLNLQEGGSDVIAISDTRDILFGQTGGTTSDPDFEVDGYARFDGTTEFETIDVDGTSDFAQAAVFNDRVDVGGALAVTGSMYILGNFEVGGATTYITSSNLLIGDNIIELNTAGAAADAGIYVYDVTGNQTGSILWDRTNNYWKGGLKDSEYRLPEQVSTSDLTANRLVYADASGRISSSNNISDMETYIDVNDVDLTSINKLEGVDTVTYIDLGNSDSIETKGNLYPTTNNVDDLGKTAQRFKDLWLQGNADLEGDIDVNGTANLDNTDIDGTLDVSGVADFQSRVDAQASLAVTGSVYVSAGASVAAASASLVSFRNDSSTQLGYLASADTQAVTTGLVGYNTSTGNLTISSVIDGGSF